MPRCRLCHDLEKKDEDDVRAAFDFTPRQLLESVSVEECIPCTLILEGITQFEDDTWSFEEDVRLVYATALGGNDESLSLEIYFSDDRPKLVLEVFSKAEKRQEYPTQPFAAIRARNSVSGHPLSPIGQLWVTSVLESCLADHRLCRSNRNVLLPRRVLAFGRHEDDTIRVRVQENDKVWGRYNALSHCWVLTLTCFTTSHNLPELKKSIPWTALPKTFQDSIIYSLQLGVHYIWIDALCIIQDDPDDWQIESGKMSEIYQNAFITLAATASKDGQGGCFSADWETASPNEFKLNSSPSPASKIMAREKIKHWTVPPSAETLKHHPLLTRGWASQERLLSPRVLHFCNQELVWECQNWTECECGGYITRLEHTRYFFRFVEEARSQESLNEGPSSTTSNSEVPNTPDDTRRMSDQWHHIIEQYSALSLTKETDRLPALSGLAQRTSSVLGQYVAGLWSNTLVSDLMWRVNKLDASLPRPVKYVGPSWSWVSIDGPVSYWADLDSAIGELLKEVNDEEDRLSGMSGFPLTLEWAPFLLRLNNKKKAATRAGGINRNASTFTFHPIGHLVKSASKNPFGSISSGALLLARHIQPARLRYVYSRQGYGSGVPLSSGRREIDKLKYILSTDHAELSFFADYILCEDGPHRLHENHTLYMMALHPDVCLVLKRVSWEGGKGGNDLLFSTYKRVGIIRQPRSFLDTYMLDWMSGSKQELIMINWGL